jgi:hypothetical protein
MNVPRGLPRSHPRYGDDFIPAESQLKSRREKRPTEIEMIHQENRSSSVRDCTLILQ